MSDLQDAIKAFLAFGHPREGSFRYHAAWEKLKEEYDKSTCPTGIPLGGYKPNEMICVLGVKEKLDKS